MHQCSCCKNPKYHRTDAHIHHFTYTDGAFFVHKKTARDKKQYKLRNNISDSNCPAKRQRLSLLHNGSTAKSFQRAAQVEPSLSPNFNTAPPRIINDVVRWTIERRSLPRVLRNLHHSLQYMGSSLPHQPHQHLHSPSKT